MKEWQDGLAEGRDKEIEKIMDAAGTVGGGSRLWGCIVTGKQIGRAHV